MEMKHPQIEKPGTDTQPLPSLPSALIIVPSAVVDGMTIDTHLRFALQYTKFILPENIDDKHFNDYRAEIILEREEGAADSVQLPDAMMKRLFHYLMDPPQSVFDCGCFVQCLYGQAVTPDTFDFSLFDKQEYDSHTAVPVGDAVVIYDAKTKEALHFALSLGNDLYLFKTGWRASQTLTVASFASMALVYGSDKAKVLHPK